MTGTTLREVRMAEPLVIPEDGKTIIRDCELRFEGCDGIKFKPTKPSRPVRVSMLVLENVHIYADGLALDLQGCGKETRLDNVTVTGKKGGAVLEDWDGGDISKLYAFDCHEFGIDIDRMHAASFYLESRQTRGGKGVIASGLRGVSGAMYTESNDLIGLKMRDCEHVDLRIHAENNNCGITGERDWSSMGHRFQQVEVRRSRGLNFSGFYGRETGQLIGDDPSLSNIRHGADSASCSPGSFRSIELSPPTWGRFWPNRRHRPEVELNPGGFLGQALVKFPRGCFDHANQNRSKSQRWYLYGNPGRQAAGPKRLPTDSLCQVVVFAAIPPNIRADLKAMHDQGKQNALGVLGYGGGLEYNPTWHEKGYQTLHAWSGSRYPAAISSTVLRQASTVSPNWQPCSGIDSWDNPAFDVYLSFGVSNYHG